MCNCSCNIDCPVCPTCSRSFPPPFCIIEPWRGSIVPILDHISGRGTPGALVRVMIDTTNPELTATVDPDGWWCMAVPFAIADGPHLISTVQQVGVNLDFFELPFVQSPIQPLGA